MLAYDKTKKFCSWVKRHEHEWKEWNKWRKLRGKLPFTKQMSHADEIYSKENIINNDVSIIFVWWPMVTRLIVAINLQCVEISNLYVMHQELTECLL